MENEFVLETVLTCLDFASACRLLGCELDTWRDRFKWVNGYKRLHFIFSGLNLWPLDAVWQRRVELNPELEPDEVCWPSGAFTIFTRYNAMHHVDTMDTHSGQRWYQNIRNVYHGHGITIVRTKQAFMMHTEGCGACDTVFRPEEYELAGDVDEMVFVLSPTRVMIVEVNHTVYVGHLVLTGIPEEFRGRCIFLRVFDRDALGWRLTAKALSHLQRRDFELHSYHDTGSGFAFIGEQTLYHVDDSFHVVPVVSFRTKVARVVSHGGVIVVMLKSGHLVVLQGTKVAHVLDCRIEVDRICASDADVELDGAWFRSADHFVVGVNNTQCMIDLITGHFSWCTRKRELVTDPLGRASPVHQHTFYWHPNTFVWSTPNGFICRRECYYYDHLVHYSIHPI